MKGLQLIRKHFTKESIAGELYEGDKKICYTLELPWQDNKFSISCIPEGEYFVHGRKAHESYKFKYQHFILAGTTPRKYILIHRGNVVDHTDGCILVGDELLVDIQYRGKTYEHFVTNSKKTLQKLVKRLDEVAELKIKDGRFLSRFL